MFGPQDIEIDRATECVKVVKRSHTTVLEGVLIYNVEQSVTPCVMKSNVNNTLKAYDKSGAAQDMHKSLCALVTKVNSMKKLTDEATA